MSEVAFGITREACSFSRHCCCCCCHHRLNTGLTQATTNRKSVVDYSSGALTSTGSRNSGADRLKRLKANGRERDRMHALNSALARLRSILPTGNGRTRLRSKIATLRAAHNYIRVLSSALAGLESTKSRKVETDSGICSTLSSVYGETTQWQLKTYFGGVLRQPEVKSSDVISNHPPVLSRQMSLACQHPEFPFHAVVSYTLQRKSLPVEIELERCSTDGNYRGSHSHGYWHVCSLHRGMRRE